MNEGQNALTPTLEPLLEDASFLLDLEESVDSKKEKKEEIESVGFSDADLAEMLENQGTPIAEKSKEEAVQTSQSLWQTPKHESNKIDLYQKLYDLLNANITPLYDQLREIREDIKTLREENKEKKKEGGMVTPDVNSIRNVIEAPKMESAAVILKSEQESQQLLNTKDIPEIGSITQEVLELGKTTQDNSKEEQTEDNVFKTAGNKKVHINEENIRRASTLFAELENTESEPYDDSKNDIELKKILARKPVNKLLPKKQFKVPSPLVKKKGKHKLEANEIREKMLIENNSIEDKPIDKAATLPKTNYLSKQKSTLHKVSKNEEKKVKNAGTGYKKQKFAPPTMIGTKRPTQELHKAENKRTYKMTDSTDTCKVMKTTESPINILIDQSVFHWLQSILNKCKDGPIIPLKLQNTPLNGIEKMKKELVEFECLCTSKGQCTVCQGKKKIGPKELHAFLFVSVKNDIPLHWIQNNYQYIQWRLILYSKISGKKLFNMENFMYQLWKRCNNEYMFGKYSFLHNVIIEDKVSMATHCVLLVIDIQYNEDKDLFVIEVSDDHYSILSTDILVNDPLYEIIKRQKIMIGDKIHSIGAELVQGEKLNNEPLSEYRIKLYYNQIAKALSGSVLGIHRKAYLYKSISSLSPYGGPIFMLDVVVIEKIIQEENTIMKVADYLNKEEVKIHVRKNLDQIDRVQEGVRMKIFNTVGIVGESGLLEIKDCERTRIILYNL